ncbi:MAG: alpha-hydroxy-acid oxidizing protein [Chloroflexi bacterium]|nr:alpha-hydroxy-acid oxidizing protein [Chloroflexota bacterium]
MEARARERLPLGAQTYVGTGAGDERSMADNIAAFQRWVFRPRALVDTSARDLSTSVLGRSIAFPVGVAPYALQRLLHPEGELATVRAVSAARSFMVVSMGATCTLEEIAVAATCPLWFQPYLFDDAGYMAELVQRAEAAGYSAVCLTVDSPVFGWREGSMRNPHILPAGVVWANMPPAMRVPNSGRWLTGGDTWRWAMADKLTAGTTLPLVLKGIVTAEDATLAVEHGVAAVVVSNHGGRQLEDTIATMDALPEVVAAIDGRAEVLLDGGVRRGIDVLKALALGARAVLVGRPAAWGLAAAGEAGVARILELLRSDLSTAMAIAGVTSAARVDRALVTRRPA